MTGFLLCRVADFRSGKIASGSGTAIRRGDIAVSYPPEATGALLEIAFFEDDVLSVVDDRCGSIIILFESKTAVEKTDIPDVSEVPGISWDWPYVAREPLIVFWRIQ